MSVCKYCGKEMERHYDYSDRMEWYECNCELHLQINQKKQEIVIAERALCKLKNELSSLESESLYEVELRELNRKFGK